MTTVTVESAVQRRVGGWYERVTTRWCYAFLVPALILTGMFTFYPMIMSWVYSTLNWSGFTSDTTFVGLGNYRELLGDRDFWSALGRSMIFVLVGTPLRVGLALVIAIILNRQVMRLSAVFRTFFFLPVMASASIIGVVMTFVLTPNNGPANSLLVGSGLASQPIDFLGDPGLAIWSVLGVHTWKNLGITMIYWLAALQTVPAEYYEAARIDGAGWSQLVRHITMPILMPFSMIIIVLTAKENLQAFAIIQAMTQGGPYFSTEVIEVFIYQTAFVGEENGGVPRLGYASAAGCFFGTITLLFALVQLWVVRRVAETRRQLGAVKADAP